MDVPPRRHVEQPEEQVHVAVEPALGLDSSLQAPRQRIGDAGISQHRTGESRDPLLAEAIQPLQYGLVLRTPVLARAL